VLVLTVTILLGMAAGYALGGRLGNLSQMHLKHTWLVLASFLPQFVIFTPLGEGIDESVSVAIHLVTYVMLLAFIALNRRDPGITFAGVGVVANALVIFANGGYMPASPRALDYAGFVTTSETHYNSAVADHGVRLLMLGDVMATPDWVPLVSNVFSVGDVLIAIGVAIVIAQGMRGSAPARPVRIPVRGGRAETP
jgi:hypothetical protein